MKRIVPIALAALAAACAPQDEVETASAASSEAAAELAGRTAGDPVSCVNLRDLRGNRSLADGSILFEGPGDLVYVNRPPGGCATLNSGRTLVTRTTATRLCRGDIVTIVDPVSRTQFGSCGLGDFVPYRRAR